MLLYYHTNVSAETMYKNYTKGEIYIMSKINKRFFNAILFVGVVFLGLTIKDDLVQAGQNLGDYHDRAFAIQYDGGGGDVMPAKRRKYNSTSIYTKDNDNVVDWFVTPVAVVNNRTIDCHVGDYATYVPCNKGTYVQNLVNERGYEYCSLWITPSVHYPCLIKGVWSPDSI